MDSVQLVTITNSGYKDITENSILSLTKINLHLGKVIIYCIDDDSFSYFKGKFPDLNVKRSSVTYSDYVEYQEEAWKMVTFTKIISVYNELLKHNYVILFDGDIVFRNINFLSDLWNRINRTNSIDLVCQNEYKPGNSGELCSGFYIIKSNDRTKKMFNIKYSDVSEKNDQDWLNSKKMQLNFEVLPNELYPNGKFFYDSIDKTIPYVIHFNFVKFRQKKNKIKQNNMWYL